jgi:hypothetical protein
LDLLAARVTPLNHGKSARFVWLQFDTFYFANQEEVGEYRNQRINGYKYQGRGKRTIIHFDQVTDRNRGGDACNVAKRIKKTGI